MGYMIDKTLRKLGLRDEEIKTFLYLLENGEQVAGALAKKTGLSRPSLYGFLQKLKERGLVIESQKNGVKIFQTSSKEKIQAILDEQISDLEKGKSDIEKVFSEIQKGGVTVNPKFQLFEGKEGMKQVLKDMLLYRDIETKAYWPIKAMIEILSEDFFKTLNKERIRQRLYTKAIWPNTQALDIKSHPYLGIGKKFLREIRIAPKDISFSMGYWIYGDKVAFISSKKEAFGFIIESRELVEMLSSQFEIIWQLSKLINAKESDGQEFLNEMK